MSQAELNTRVMKPSVEFRLAHGADHREEKEGAAQYASRVPRGRRLQVGRPREGRRATWSPAWRRGPRAR